MDARHRCARSQSAASTTRAVFRWALTLSLLLTATASLAAHHHTPALMLASPMREGIDVSRYWVSEKLDGVRARWDGEQLLTRGGARVAAPDWFTAPLPAILIDGELWLGRGRFEATSALVRRAKAEDAAWREVKFMAFDLPADAGGFNTRAQHLRAIVEQARVPWLQAVPQFRVSTSAQLHARLREITDAGGEGLMLHHQEGRYRAGRSDTLLKLKPHDDAEARVIGHLPGKGKYIGMMGALSLQCPDGRRFRLGTGFTDAQRARPPPLGSVVTYRYSGLTRLGLPRFARFLRVRDEEPEQKPPP